MQQRWQQRMVQANTYHAQHPELVKEFNRLTNGECAGGAAGVHWGAVRAWQSKHYQLNNLVADGKIGQATLQAARMLAGEADHDTDRLIGRDVEAPADGGDLVMGAHEAHESLSEGRDQPPIHEAPAPGPAPGPAPPGTHRMIAFGSVGPDVALAQSRLNDHGATPALVEDGIFGPKTRAATLAFQNINRLAPDGIIGPLTWAALEASGNQQRGQSPGGAPGPHTNVLYDNSGYTLAAPATGAKVADVKADVDALKAAKPPDLTGASVSGVTVGSEEELFVWNVIAQLGKRNRWGTEADLRTPIGRPKGGAAAPIGLVTLRIDLKGNATAELLKGATIIGPTTFATRVDAETRLKSDFGFSEVKDGSATWTLPELGKMHAALSTLSGAEKAALVGVALIREHTLTVNGKPAAGAFSHSASVGPSGPATRSDSISIADSAFANDNLSFVGGKSNAAAESFETIVHEAGHAVETKALRDAQFDQFTAQATQNAQTATFNQANSASNAAITNFNTESTSAFAKAKGYAKADQAAMSAYRSALNAATTALSALSTPSTANGITGIEAKAVAAVAKRAAEQAKLKAANASHPALNDFAATDAAQDAWLAAAQVRAKELVKLDAAKAATTAAKAKVAVKGSGGHSKRLSNFVAFVNKNGILPFTEYARQNWPGTPDEFYAEAFSLFHTDPEFMQTNYKPLFDWFTQGEHLK
jgi:peptidoglycan hydrolase-like protein with peptidoglycan-binding domain